MIRAEYPGKYEEEEDPPKVKVVDTKKVTEGRGNVYRGVMECGHLTVSWAVTNTSARKFIGQHHKCWICSGEKDQQEAGIKNDT